MSEGIELPESHHLHEIIRWSFPSQLRFRSWRICSGVSLLGHGHTPKACAGNTSGEPLAQYQAKSVRLHEAQGFSDWSSSSHR